MERKEKMDTDYTISVDISIKKARNLLQQNKFNEAIEELFSVEKQTRLAQQGESVTKVLVEIVCICGDNNRWKELNEVVVVLSKKRNQIKQAISKMVQEGMKYIDRTPNLDTKISLIETLREVCEGKMFVEVERAHLIRMLAKIKEDGGDISTAADLLQQVQVETIGSMEEKEKIDFILEAMRLTYLKKDFIRMYIISRKITVRAISREGVEPLRVRYYELLIKYWIEQEDFLQITHCYFNILKTRNLAEDKQREALQYMTLYVILAPFDNEQSDVMSRIFEEKMIEESTLKKYKLILKKFRGNELIFWKTNMKEMYEKFLSKHPVFYNQPKRLEHLRTRCVEHNLMVIARFYSKITTERLTELIGTDNIKETEDYVSRLVTNATISAKIDRLDNVVNFGKREELGDVLNTWGASVEHVLQLLTKTNHLIQKEEVLKKKVSN